MTSIARGRDRDRGIKEFADFLMDEMVFGRFINRRNKMNYQSLYARCQMEFWMIQKQRQKKIKYKLQSQVTT